MIGFLIGQDIPEGLSLQFAYNGDGEACIMDEQEVIWVRFGPGGNGDPETWRHTIIRETCKALDVKVAYSPDGEQFMPVDKFIEEYLTDE